MTFISACNELLYVRATCKVLAREADEAIDPAHLLVGGHLVIVDKRIAAGLLHKLGQGNLRDKGWVTTLRSPCLRLRERDALT